MSLVCSRLLYNVHVWTSMSRREYAKLSGVYMRGARAIGGKQRFDKASAAEASDSQVRQQLGWPNLHCVIARRCLSLFAFLLQNALGRFLLSWQSGKVLSDSPGLKCWCPM